MKILFRGKRLKAIRENRGLTQGQLAKLTGLHITTIGNYEIDRREPKATQLKLLADALAVSMEEFFEDHKKEVTRKNKTKKGGKSV
ncbi:MAG: helix-turn-helix domain-containing protein [Thermodesulfobacteriota bacterium]